MPTMRNRRGLRSLLVMVFVATGTLIHYLRHNPLLRLSTLDSSVLAATTIQTQKQQQQKSQSFQEESPHSIHSSAMAQQQLPPPPPQCSDAEMVTLVQTFYPRFLKQSNLTFWQRLDTPLYKHTSCPSERLLHDYFVARPRDSSSSSSSSSSFLGVNVGCNKGLDAISMARTLSRNPHYQVQEWRQALGTTGKPVCGMPINMDLSTSTSSMPLNGTIHCIEPLPTTVTSLQQALAQTGYASAVKIQQAVMSNTSGTTKFPTSTESGGEFFSMGHCETEPEKYKCQNVPMFTVDDYLKQHDDDDDDTTSTKSRRPIDMLLIDAEGFDYEVLQGSKATLDRVRYLAFEVHAAGNWLSHSLNDLINNDDSVLRDFNCYWLGKRGQLWRITNCVNDALDEIYEFKSWSNVGCVHRRETELADKMEGIFQRTVHPING